MTNAVAIPEPNIAGTATKESNVKRPIPERPWPLKGKERNEKKVCGDF